MKTLLTAFILFSAVSASAEVLEIKIKKAGTYLVTLTKEASCMPAEFALTPKERGPMEVGSGEYVNVTVSQVVNTWGRAQMCGGSHKATGYFVARADTVLNVELNEELLNPEITLTEIKK
ncbi:MAG: hypothetical protein V4598_11155 [Bdellovibrionota bacterium]